MKANWNNTKQREKGAKEKTHKTHRYRETLIRVHRNPIKTDTKTVTYKQKTCKVCVGVCMCVCIFILCWLSTTTGHGACP